jgi:hypothetical protein
MQQQADKYNPQNTIEWFSVPVHLCSPTTLPLQVLYRHPARYFQGHVSVHLQIFYHAAGYHTHCNLRGCKLLLR